MWAIDAYHNIMEDEERNWQVLLSVLPVARTPMDKKGSKIMERGMKQLRRMLTNMFTPWIVNKRRSHIKERLEKPPVGKVYDESGKEIDLNDQDWWKKVV